MVVGICTIALHLPHARSLKDKRRILKSLKDRLRSRHNISLAEVDGQDLWQRATLAIAAVGLARTPIEQLFQAIHREIEEKVPGQIVDRDISFV
jgi:hypothetical protein